MRVMAFRQCSTNAILPCISLDHMVITYIKYQTKQDLVGPTVSYSWTFFTNLQKKADNFLRQMSDKYS